MNVFNNKCISGFYEILPYIFYKSYIKYNLGNYIFCNIHNELQLELTNLQINETSKIDTEENYEETLIYDDTLVYEDTGIEVIENAKDENIEQKDHNKENPIIFMARY